MSGFRKAKAEQAALKTAIYGPPGSGKTFTTLLLAEGLAARDGKRIAYVDTERGTDFYCKTVPERAIHPEAFDFDALYTRSITEVLSELKGLDPAVYGVIAIDSMTHIWEAAKAAYAGRQTKIGTIPFQAWTAIKKPYKDIMTLLLSSPMHVFILGRQGTDYATDEETDELKAVGLKMKAEGETAYEPHILLRMEAVKPRKTNMPATIVAYAEKDRTGVLSGRSFANPTFESICVPLLGLLGGSQAQMKSAEEVGSADAEAIERADHQQAAASEELMRTFCARIELADSAAALKKIGDGLTPVKARMRSTDLATVREKYLRRRAALPDEGKTPHGDPNARPGKYGDTPHDPETGEIIPEPYVERAAAHSHALKEASSEVITDEMAKAARTDKYGRVDEDKTTEALATSAKEVLGGKRLPVIGPATEKLAEALADPTGEKAGELLADRLDERRQLMGLI